MSRLVEIPRLVYRVVPGNSTPRTAQFSCSSQLFVIYKLYAAIRKLFRVTGPLWTVNVPV